MFPRHMKFASVKLALRTFRSRRSSPRRFVPVRSTLSSVAPFRFACHRSARTSLIEERLAFDKSARRRPALSKFNPLKFTPLRLQPAHDPGSVSVCRSPRSTRAIANIRRSQPAKRPRLSVTGFLTLLRRLLHTNTHGHHQTYATYSHWIGTNLSVIYIHSNFHLAKVSYALSFPTFLNE